jgi:hypothetical protein
MRFAAKFGILGRVVYHCTACAVISSSKTAKALAQFNWSYLSPSGQQYIVGLYHGPESGHLVVYCNNDIVAIDFNVAADAKYPFFIEEDLCEIRIERRGDKLHYFFESNEEVDTPLNRVRRQRKQRDRRFLRVLIVGAVLFVVGMVVMMLSMQQSEDESALKTVENGGGLPAIGRVAFDPDTTGSEWIAFWYVADGAVKQGKAPMPPARRLPNGMVLEPGDEFTVHYHFVRTHIALIDFDSPTPEQTERYRRRALAEHLRLHPELVEKEVDCLLGIAFEIKDLAGYADFYWQTAEPQENPEHNFNSYYRLVRDTSFVRRLRERCP